MTELISEQLYFMESCAIKWTRRGWKDSIEKCLARLPCNHLLLIDTQSGPEFGDVFKSLGGALAVPRCRSLFKLTQLDAISTLIAESFEPNDYRLEYITLWVASKDSEITSPPCSLFHYTESPGRLQSGPEPRQKHDSLESMFGWMMNNSIIYGLSFGLFTVEIFCALSHLEENIWF